MFADTLRRPFGAILATLVLISPAGALASAPGGAPTAPPPVMTSPSPGAPATGPAAPPALAAVKVTREQAIAIAQKLFTIPAELGEPNANVSQSNGIATWSLNWQSAEKKAEHLSIHAEVDAGTGEVRSYNRYASGTGSDAATELTYTRSEALERALQWLAKLAPGYQEAVRFLDNPLGYGYYGRQSGYSFHWDRLGGSYPVPGQGIDLSINANTGDLESFSRNWQRETVLQDPAAMLERTKAESIYRELVPMLLQYQHFQKPGANEGEWRLVYRPQIGYYPKITQDGGLLTPAGSALDQAILKEMKVVPSSEQPYVVPTTLLTQEQALVIARKVSGRTDAPTNSNYMESGKEQKTRAWGFNWYQNGELKDGEFNTNVTIDAERGVITEFRNWGPYQPPKAGEEPKLTDVQAREAAIAFIRANRPDLAGNVMLMPNVDYYPVKMGTRPQTQGMGFMTMKNGIPVAGWTVQIEVNMRTGAIQSFWANLPQETKEPFPPADGLLSGGEAMAAMLKTLGLDLTWSTYGNTYPGKFSTMEEPPKPQLVWGPSRKLPIQFIDAKTGTLLDDGGRDLVEAAKRPVDIEGHYAQREIELLWVRGIFELKDGKFQPGTAITAAEAARWLVTARGFQPYLAYDFGRGFAGNAQLAAKLSSATEAPYFGAALQNGIILPADFASDAAPNSPVSRELFALWAARAMGYGAIARMPNHIEMPFADKDAVGARYANAVAILNGLGIVKGDGYAFYPQQELTRGAAARILFAVASHVNR